MKTSVLGTLVTGTMLLVAAAGSAASQGYPDKPIRLILPFAAGGGGDTFARPLAPALAEALGQPVVIENITGAAGVIGAGVAARAAPDGYTILMLSNSQVINEITFPNRSYVLMRDFVPITELASNSLVLVVNPSVRADSVKELVALAKTQPHGLAFGSPGRNSIHHLAMELFMAATGTQMLHVPYRASGQARTDLIGGQVQLMFDLFPTMQAFIKSGQVRPIGIGDTQRLDLAPEIPTIAESGVAGFETSSWLGFMAPAGTPQPIIDRLQSEISKYLQRADAQAFYKVQGAIPIGSTPAQFKVVLQDELTKWSKVLKDHNIKAD